MSSIQLNAALAVAAETNGATFVDVTDRWEGNGVGSDDPWLYLHLADLADQNNLHPTSEGYPSGYFPAVMSTMSVRTTRTLGRTSRYDVRPFRGCLEGAIGNRGARPPPVRGRDRDCAV